MNKTARANIMDSKKYFCLQIESLDVLKSSEKEHLMASILAATWKMWVCRKFFSKIFLPLWKEKQISVEKQTQWWMRGLCCLQDDASKEFRTLFQNQETEDRSAILLEQLDRINNIMRRFLRDWGALLERLESKLRNRVKVEEALVYVFFNEMGFRMNVVAWSEALYNLRIFRSHKIQSRQIIERQHIVAEERAARLGIKSEARTYIQVGKYA